MAGSVNKVILIGNVGRDPEVRNTANGNKMVNLSIATSESWKDRNTGERKQNTEWHRIVIFNKNLCDLAEQYVRKGSKLYIEGSIKSRTYDAQDGSQRSTTEIVLGNFGGVMTLLDSASSGNGENRQAAESVGRTAKSKEIIDDDIPF